MEIPVDYTGFTIPDQFVVGYGLDYGELYRNLRYVGVLAPRGLHPGPTASDHASPAARPGSDARWPRWPALLIVVGCILPWWQVGGDARHHRAVRATGSTGSGILVFLVGIATLALVALPYAAGDRPLGARPLAVVRDPGRGRLDRLRLAGRGARC